MPLRHRVRSCADRAGRAGLDRVHARALEQFADQACIVAVSGGSEADRAECCPDARALPAEQIAADPDVDVVVIATPAGSHARYARAAVRVGHDVVVEKPLAANLAEAEQLVAEAGDAGVTVSVVAPRRLEPLNREVYALLRQGRLGTPVLGEALVHWHRDAAYYAATPWRRRIDEPAGSLPNQGLHGLDLLLWLLGEVEAVTAQQATLGSDFPFDDTTAATLRFRSSALGVVVTITAAPPGRPAELAVFTDRGSFALSHDTLARWDVTGCDAPTTTDDTSGVGSGAADPAAIGVAGHLAHWQDLLDARRVGRSPTVTGADGLATLRMIDAIERAAATGTTVRLPPVSAGSA